MKKFSALILSGAARKKNIVERGENDVRRSLLPSEAIGSLGEKPLFFGNFC